MNSWNIYEKTRRIFNRFYFSINGIMCLQIKQLCFRLNTIIIITIFDYFRFDSFFKKSPQKKLFVNLNIYYSKSVI